MRKPEILWRRGRAPLTGESSGVAVPGQRQRDKAPLRLPARTNSSAVFRGRREDRGESRLLFLRARGGRFISLRAAARRLDLSSAGMESRT